MGWFAPGGKIEMILKNLVRWKVFLKAGKILGGYKRAIHGRKNRQAPKKRSSKNFWSITLKSRGATYSLTTPLYIGQMRMYTVLVNNI